MVKHPPKSPKAISSPLKGGQEEGKFFTYVLRCADNSLYTGWTTDLERRLKEHNGGKAGGAKCTAARRPVTLAYFEELPTKSAAMKRECAIKRMTHLQKEKLIKAAANIKCGVRSAECGVRSYGKKIRRANFRLDLSLLILRH